MVECLADELRLSLEHAWGVDPHASRVTATGDHVSKLPQGCTAGAKPPPLLEGMEPLEAPVNQNMARRQGEIARGSHPDF